MATTLDFNINSFREKLGGGARSNLFRCELTGVPGSLNFDGPQFSFLCRSAAIPSYTLGIIEVPYRGRRIKIPGDRTFAEWTVTVVNDEKQKLRAFFDEWLKLINDPDGTNAPRVTTTDDYRCEVDIYHLKSDGNTSRQYRLVDAFPTDVSAIDLSYDTTDAIQEFTVTFQYHFVDVGQGAGVPTASNAG